jgi:carboxymethylenebutenolidase
MHTINRREAVAGLALLAVSGPARAGMPEQLSVEADEGSVALTRYPTDQAGRRPSVLLLHGSHGFELKPRAYQRYADALSAKGIDAYLIRYLRPMRRLSNPRRRRRAVKLMRQDDSIAGRSGFLPR